jgi:AraC-like DNA-binding protein/ligand-binding sensor protein
VLKGQGKHKLNQQETEIKAGQLIHCPPYSIHEVVNPTDEELKIMLVYAPAKSGYYERHMTLLTASKPNGLGSLISPELLMPVQDGFAQRLGIAIRVYDILGKPITEPSGMPEFCRIVSETDKSACPSQEVSAEEMLKEDIQISPCCCGLLMMSLPLKFGDDVIGYVQAGPVQISQPWSCQQKVYQLAKTIHVEAESLMNSYSKLPAIPKSRIYAHAEGLSGMARFIEGMLNTPKTWLLNDKNIDVAQDPVPDQFYPIERELGIIKKIAANDIEGAMVVADLLVSDVVENASDIQTQKMILTETLMVLLRVIPGDSLSIEGSLALRSAFRESIMSCSKPEELKNVFCRNIKQLAGNFGGNVWSRDRDVIMEAMECIRRNFRQKLTLEMVAQSVYLSPNYFSYLFKEQTGNTFIEYLTRIRLQEAKQLLIETELSVRDIAEKVGYNDPSYFGMVFRKSESMTPGRYRSLNKKAISKNRA